MSTLQHIMYCISIDQFIQKKWKLPFRNSADNPYSDQYFSKQPSNTLYTLSVSFIRLKNKLQPSSLSHASQCSRANESYKTDL